MIGIPALWRRIARKLRAESGVPSLARRYPDREIGRGSYGNVEIAEFGNDAHLSIGAYCSFAEGGIIMLGGEHRPDWVTTFPFNALDPRFRHIEGHPASRGDVRIGNDVWVGREALILSGVTIGDGAVIGARAVVAKDVPPYAIAVGNPARVVRHRFDDETVGRLLAVKWWDWSEERIARAIPAMLDTDIGDFLTQVEEGRL